MEIVNKRCIAQGNIDIKSLDLKSYFYCTGSSKKKRIIYGNNLGRLDPNRTTRRASLILGIENGWYDRPERGK